MNYNHFRIVVSCQTARGRSAFSTQGRRNPPGKIHPKRWRDSLRQDIARLTQISTGDNIEHHTGKFGEQTFAAPYAAHLSFINIYELKYFFALHFSLQFS